MTITDSELTDPKRLLLQKMLSGDGAIGAESIDVDAITPRAPDTDPPASPEQRNLWLHSAMASGVPLYNESITIHRRGAFDRVAMERAFTEILRRHEAWRTSFAAVGDEIIQTVHSQVVISLPVIDLSQLPAEEREAEALRIATADVRKPIDCGRAPLLRLHGLKLDEDEHRIYLTLHHIIFDGVSIYRVILPELAELYQAFAAGKEPTLPDVGLQYGDYACWRQRRVQSKVVGEQLDYWRRMLSGPLPVLQLPTDRARPPLRSYRGSMEIFAVPGEVSEALKVISRNEGVTLYMTLLAAFKTLLHRYSGQDDIIIGGVTDTRRRPELERVVGYFLNSIVLRTRPSGTMSFRDYLRQVRDSVTGALDASDIPFDHVVRELVPVRDSSAHPFFQVLFSMQPPAPVLRGFDLTQTDVHAGAAKFDLYLELEERPEGLIGRFIYSTDHFDPTTVRRMVGHWLTLLQGIASDPSCSLARLPIMTDTEIRCLAVWNDTAMPVPPLVLHEWFDVQASRRPGAVAIVCNGNACTYGALNRRASILAKRLRNAGVVKGDLIGISIERSIDMVAALLGILKAGGAYLPLDPQFPSERLKVIIDDASPSALLTQRSIVEKLPRSNAVTIFCDDDSVEGEDDPDLTVDVAAEDLAYVLYTSGSTGKPKGVEIPHRALVNLLASIHREPGFAATDRMLAISTLSFDIATAEIFIPLLAGGQLVIATSDIAADPNLLKGLITSSGCTVMDATPATWRSLIEAGWSGREHLKIFCTGETLPRQLADKLLARGESVWNLYGPTETTVWSTIQKVESGKGPVPIGKPIANTRTFIVDAGGSPVPVGVTGELIIGGRSLARGYRNRKALTERRFASCPVAPGEKLYRTGDLARYRADGTIECLGRGDNQVKVRGFRVEAEEVESFLLKHRNVTAAAVKAWPDASGENSLIGYVVARHEPAPSAAELRQFLREYLPDYMLPSRYVAMQQLPMTPNRKVDRKALPNPKDIQQPLEVREPRSETERRLAAIWKDILGVRAVSVQDNFFDLGGHSLLAAKLLKRIETEFGHSLSLAAVFYAPQLDQLAARLEEEGIAPPPVIPVRPSGSRPPLFWMGGGGDIQPLVQALGPDQPFFDVLLEFPGRSEAVPRFDALAGDVVRAICAQQPDGPYYLGGYCTRGILAYEVASQLRAQGQQVDLIMMLDSANPVHFKEQIKRRRSLGHGLSILKYHGIELRHLRGLARRRYCWNLMMRLVRRLLLLGDGRPELPLPEIVLQNSALNYTPPAYDGNVALFQAGRRPSVVDQRAGWQGLVRGRFFAQDISGNHDDFIQPPNVEKLAAAIRATMMRAQQQVQQDRVEQDQMAV